jgi:hypothetical protein
MHGTTMLFEVQGYAYAPFDKGGHGGFSLVIPDLIGNPVLTLHQTI